MQRLIACRIDQGHMPLDMITALFHRASSPQNFRDPDIREEILAVACAVIQKYRYDVCKEEWSMELDLKKMDRDALFGCLLAVLEKVERDTYDREETREHNAIRLQSMYCHRPMRTFRQLNDQLDRAYFPKLKPWLRSRYRNLIGDIIYQINCRCDGDSWDAPLKETYLIGYYLQRRALYTKTDQTDTKDSDKEEL